MGECVNAGDAGFEQGSGVAVDDDRLVGRQLNCSLESRNCEFPAILLAVNEALDVP
jgi:hypothetical protein